MQPKGLSRWRWHVKSALAAAIAGAHDHQLTAALSRTPAVPLVLGYHRVVEDFDAAAIKEMPSMLTSRAMFERHLDALSKHFRFMSLDDIGAQLASGEPFSEPVAAITFDDGYRDVYENAYPVLKRKGIPAAVFVVTDLVGKPFWQIHDKLYRLVAKAFSVWDDPRRNFMGLLSDLELPASDLLGPRASTATPMLTVSALLGVVAMDVHRLLEGLEAAVGNGFGPVPQTLTWAMLREMQSAGFVIGSHTETHVSLPAESQTTMAQELEGSKRTLEMHLGESISHFAYPGGQFTRPVVQALRRAGYKYGYTACTHGDAEYPLLTIERLLLWERSSVDADGRFSPKILSCQAHGLWPPTRKCGRSH